MDYSTGRGLVPEEEAELDAEAIRRQIEEEMYINFAKNEPPSSATEFLERPPSGPLPSGRGDGASNQPNDPSKYVAEKAKAKVILFFFFGLKQR